MIPKFLAIQRKYIMPSGREAVCTYAGVKRVTFDYLDGDDSVILSPAVAERICKLSASNKYLEASKWLTGR